MRNLVSSRKVRAQASAFTLLELLLVIVVIAILFSLLLPVIERTRQRARQAGCMSNLKQIGAGFYSYKQEHEDRIPSAIPINEGGVKEVFFAPGPVLLPDWESNVFRIFQAMSNHLHTPRVLVCQADKLTRPADNFQELKPSALKRHPNVSYAALVAFGGLGEGSKVLWAGDSTGDKRAWDEYLPTFAGQDEGERLGTISLWANHGYTRGNWLFGDGRVEAFGSAAQGLYSAGSLNPVVIVSTSSGGGSATGPGASSNNTNSSGSDSAGTSSSGGQGQSAAASSASGNAPSGPSGASGSSPGSASSAASATFQRLETFFQGRPAEGPRPSARVSPRAAESAAIPPRPGANASALPTVRSNLPVPLPTNVPGPARIETTPPNLWLAPQVEIPAGREYRTTYWLLFLLLLIIVAMVIQRQWRKRARRKPAGPEAT